MWLLDFKRYVASVDNINHSSKVHSGFYISMLFFMSAMSLKCSILKVSKVLRILIV